HKLVKDGRYLGRHMASDSCIDDITVQANIENGVIKDICFDGVACTISTASTSMMSELLLNKNVEEAKKIIEQFFLMADGKDYDEDIIGEAIAFQNVHKQANRIKCATTGWQAIAEMIEESEGKDERKE
ncbi:MAG: SUF system NifU family Fe-S cluster assembly protein, partial [Solobacterium sp.]|nr:SUF system NifU family Fe-S cluster assembly protein [Solobacterium sp.]